MAAHGGGVPMTSRTGDDATAAEAQAGSGSEFGTGGGSDDGARWAAAV